MGALEDCAASIWKQRESRAATTLLKCASVCAGIFLLVAGILGFSAIMFGQIIYFVGSFYTVTFGVLVTVVELKDKMPIISVIYGWIDTYLKFMTTQAHPPPRPVLRRRRNRAQLPRARLRCALTPAPPPTAQRGKGMFYWGVGLLICFIAPDGTRDWGINNVAALVLAILGFIHT